MRPTLQLFGALALLAALLPVPRPAAAETSQTCAGFIDSLPATITTQGTWCMRAALSTAMASGAAIAIAANNVAIDCDDFKLGGLAAGDGTTAVGIQASSRLNATVRHCNVRGFRYGTHLTGSGHAVLDSRFDNNTYAGFLIGGDGSLARGNRVSDTGGSTVPGYGTAIGIYFDSSYAGALLDNFVEGVYATPGSNGSAYGALIYFVRGEAARNTIASLEADGTGQAFGVSNNMSGSHAVIRDNTMGVGIWDPVTGIGVRCSGAIARDNTISGFATALNGCADAGGNFAN